MKNTAKRLLSILLAVMMMLGLNLLTLPAQALDPTPLLVTITGPTEMTLYVGYAATSTEAYTVKGAGATVTKTGNSKITWNNSTKKLDIAAGLAEGTYPVKLKASNGLSPDAELTFTLTVKEVPPLIAGPTEMTLTTGYAATSTEAFTVPSLGTFGTVKVEKVSGNSKITWNASTKKLDIAAGLAEGTYPVKLKASILIYTSELTFTLTVEEAMPQLVDQIIGNTDSIADAISKARITGPTEMTLTVGYAATSTEAYAVMGAGTVTVTKTSGNSKITWNNSTKKLDIAAGLAVGTYPVKLKASNDTTNAELTFTLTVEEVPEFITGPTEMTLTVGYAATSTEAFTVTGSGTVTVTITSGDSKITWNAGTKKLNIAAGLAEGTYPVKLKASNGTSPDAELTFTLTVGAAATAAAPTITGPTTLTLAVGYAATSTEAYTVTGDGTVAVEKTSGDAKITWNNTAKKLDIAAGLAEGTYPVKLKASNGTSPDAELTFTLKVEAAATAAKAGITGPEAMTLSVGYAATSTEAYTVTGEATTVAKTSGDAKITWNASAKKLDIAAGLSAGSYSVILKASNESDPAVELTFVLTVKDEPVKAGITGPKEMALATGYAATSTEAYTVVGDGTVTVTKTSGDAKITWNASTKKLDIAAGLGAGSYSVILKASNGASPDVELTFVLTVKDGAAPTPAKPFPFTDVAQIPGNWIYESVKGAWEMGLINGKTDTLFMPDDNLTYAEAVKLAACMHQLYTTGKVTLAVGAGEWYDTYVSYAKANGIIDKNYAWNTAATRAGYMEIFANALPSEALAPINTIADGAIPDVPAGHIQAGAIYRLYRAGIVQGVDAAHNCNPSANIKRSEVAAILMRMMDPDNRIKFAM